MDEVKEISTIIINRNTKNLLKQCLDSLPKGFGEISYDVWIVDNASDDGSQELIVEHYPHVNLIRNTENFGFAKANNQALRKIKTPFALLLNSDTVLPKNCIVPLYNLLEEHPKAALVGPKLIDSEGNLQPSTYPLPSLWKDFLIRSKFYKLFPKHIQAKLLLGSFCEHNQQRMVGRITGACILLRMKDIEPLNFLDESFFFYGEVHDLCLRLWKNGRQVWFTPNSFIYHLGGQTSAKTWDYKEKRRRMWRENERLLRKHQTPNYVRVSILLNWVGFLLSKIMATTIKLSNHTSHNKELLAVDYDWHSTKLKEMFCYKIRHIFYTVYRLPNYTTIFYKKFINKISFEKSNALTFNSKTTNIQNELIEKWNNEFPNRRTGFMDFSCSVLLYHIIRWLKPRIVVETGVANGVTSTFILSALDANHEGRLYSIDWPGDKHSTFVPEGKETGWMVPDQLRKRWTLEIGKSEDKLEPMLERLRQIDIFLHDSYHSYDNMMYEFKTAWPYLAKNGLLLSDDVKMNTSFEEFTKDMDTLTMIYKRRFGIAQKLK
jgi:GT2 family glycosyltransferase/predicted O-methyltransferase YrrM